MWVKLSQPINIVSGLADLSLKANESHIHDKTLFDEQTLNDVDVIHSLAYYSDFKHKTRTQASLSFL